MNTHPTPLPGRLIWIALLSVMAAALVTGQARANLHAEARASGRYSVEIDDRPTVERLCRMRFEAVAGQVSIGFDTAEDDSSLTDLHWYGGVKSPFVLHELP